MGIKSDPTLSFISSNCFNFIRSVQLCIKFCLNFQLDQYASQLGDIKPLQEKIISSLKPSNVEDKLFLQQISTIKALTEKIQSLEKLPKFITIRLSLTPLITSHSLISSAVTDAMKLLSNAVADLTEATEKAYSNGAVVAVVTVVEDTVTRSKRATVGAKSDAFVSIFSIQTHIPFAYFRQLVTCRTSIRSTSPYHTRTIIQSSLTSFCGSVLF